MENDTITIASKYIISSVYRYLAVFVDTLTILIGEFSSYLDDVHTYIEKHIYVEILIYIYQK